MRNTELDLEQPSRPSGRARFLLVRVALLLAALIWGIAGTYEGVTQQRPGLPSSAVDCSYRADLLRDRVVALIESPAAIARQAQDDPLPNLLRETQAACSAKDERLATRLDNIQQRYEAVRRSQDRVSAARQELLAQ